MRSCIRACKWAREVRVARHFLSYTRENGLLFISRKRGVEGLLPYLHFCVKKRAVAFS